MSKSNERLLKAYELGYRVTDEGVLLSPTAQKIGHINNNGYLVFNVNKQPVAAHRLRAYQTYGDELFILGIMVRHLNGNKLDNSKLNIAIGSHTDNMRDISISNRNISNLKNSLKHRIFSIEEVCFIRESFASGKSIKSIARNLNKSSSTISDIVNYKTYK